MLENQKKKRYYQISEQIWLIDQKCTGIVKNIDKANHTITVEMPNNEEITLELHKVDKYRPKPQKVPFHRLDTIFWAKVKPNAIIPTKRDEDGAYDIYACFDEQQIEIKPGETKLISTGIASALPTKYRLNAKHERGSTGKLSMAVLAGMIDSGFRNEWFIQINNAGTKTIIIDKTGTTVLETASYIVYPYTKAICQATLEIVPKTIDKEISYEELLKIPSQRGTGMLGSSGK